MNQTQVVGIHNCYKITDPNATGAVLAIRQIPAAYKGLKPNPISMAAEMATGAPNPAAPSRKAPKERQSTGLEVFGPV